MLQQFLTSPVLARSSRANRSEFRAFYTALVTGDTLPASFHRAPIPEEEPIPGEEPEPDEDPVPHQNPVIGKPDQPRRGELCSGFSLNLWTLTKQGM